MSRASEWVAASERLADLDVQHDQFARMRDITARQVAELVVTQEWDHARVLADRFADLTALLQDIDADRETARRDMETALADMPVEPTDPPWGAPRVRHITAADDGYESGMA